jgi:hypothetical protein
LFESAAKTRSTLLPPVLRCDAQLPAKHFDAYAGIMWSQAQNGLISGFLLATPGVNKLSAYDPTVGMRYQF